MSQGISRRALWMHKLAEQVARGLTEQIASGALAEGSELPGREALAAQFVTSTSVIDKALDKLLADGQLHELPDGKFRISRADRHPHLFEPADDLGTTKLDVISIMELRMGVELVSAALAAERRDDAQLAAIRKAGTEFEKSASAKHGIAQADFLFHRAIAEASGNSYILDLLEYLGPLLIPRMRMNTPITDQDVTDRNLAASVEEHAAITAAIEAGDGDAARQAMRAHLTRSIEFVRGLAETG